MKKIIQLSFLLALFGYISNARSAVLIEPVGGYNIGTKLDFEGTGGESYSGGNGWAAGGRLGFQQLGFQVGMDYLHSYVDMDDNDFNKKVNMDEFGAFVGFEFPILLRVYAGYIFAASGKTENAADEKIELSSGSGQKFGVGFTGLPFLDINLEYRRGTFGEKEVAGVESKDDTNYQSIMIGVSLPFTI